MIDKESLELVEAVRIGIDGFSDVVVEDEATLVKFEGKPALFLGECDMWYWVAPLDTLEAEKCCSCDLEYDVYPPLTIADLKGIINGETYNVE